MYESPNTLGANSACAGTGGYPTGVYYNGEEFYACQIPAWYYDYTNNVWICAEDGNCLGTFTNANPTSAYYIQHFQTDTDTIPGSSGTAWEESYQSSY